MFVTKTNNNNKPQRNSCFFDIAKNPQDSLGEYGSDLGYTLYDDEGGGKVNLDEELDTLLAKIEQQGSASILTFYEINTIFNKLYDAHVVLPQTEQGGTAYRFAIYPENRLNSLGMKPILFLDSTSSTTTETTSLQLRLEFTPTLTKIVSRISGLTVEEYMTYLANSSDLLIPYQDLGARINYLIRNYALFTGIVVGFPGSGIPTNLLPDKFIIEYTDGTFETFVVGIIASDLFYHYSSTKSPDDETNVNYLSLNRTAIESYLNSPGSQFRSFYKASLRANELGADLPDIPGLVDDGDDGVLISNNVENDDDGGDVFDGPLTRSSSTSTVTATTASTNYKKKQAQDDDDGNNDDEVPESLFTEVIPGKGGYFVHESGEYMVMKLSSFTISFNEARDLWRGVVNAAKNNGNVKRLVVDLSGNGGGYIMSGMRLLMLMFPEAPMSAFVNQWDINYNVPMTTFFDAIDSIVDLLLVEVRRLPPEVLGWHIGNFTTENFELFEVAGEAIVELCQDDPTQPGNCNQANWLKDNITEFIGYNSVTPDVFSYINLFVSLKDTIDHYSPWTVILDEVEENYRLAGIDGYPIIPELHEGGIKTHWYGGVESNFTQRFNLTPNEWIHDTTKTVNDELDYIFDEYVYVSDGITGSMASIFAFESYQLWQNSELSGVTTSVQLVTYGGLGQSTDFTIGSFPATKQGVHLEDPLIGSAALQM